MLASHLGPASCEIPAEADPRADFEASNLEASVAVSCCALSQYAEPETVKLGFGKQVKCISEVLGSSHNVSYIRQRLCMPSKHIVP